MVFDTFLVGVMVFIQRERGMARKRNEKTFGDLKTANTLSNRQARTTEEPLWEERNRRRLRKVGPLEI